MPLSSTHTKNSEYLPELHVHKEEQRRTSSPSCSTRRPRTWPPSSEPATQPAAYTNTAPPCSQALSKTRPDHKDGVHDSSNIKVKTSIASRPALKSKVLPSHAAVLHRDEALDDYGASGASNTTDYDDHGARQVTTNHNDYGASGTSARDNTDYNDHGDREVKVDQVEDSHRNCTEPGWTTRLYGDEDIYTHSDFQDYFKSTRGYGKKVTKVKERTGSAQDQQQGQGTGQGRQQDQEGGTSGQPATRPATR